MEPIKKIIEAIKNMDPGTKRNGTQLENIEKNKKQDPNTFEAKQKKL